MSANWAAMSGISAAGLADHEKLAGRGWLMRPCVPMRRGKIED